MTVRKILRAVVALCVLAMFAVGRPAAAEEPWTFPVKMSPATAKLSDRAHKLANSDPVQARALMKQAAAGGDADAIANLAAFTMQGVGKPPDPEGGRQLLEKAVAAGSLVARANLATLLLEGRDESVWPRAVGYLREAFEEPKLRPLVLYPMGLAQLFGRGLEKDEKAGIDSIESAVKMGLPDSNALYLLGRAYQNGWAERARDPARAADYFKRSADLGDRRAMRVYGMILLSGEGVAADGPAAAALFRRAAELGHRTAMIDLAVMLATGEAGTRKDQVEAREWYRKAALLGSAHALRGLGGMLHTGEGGEADRPTGWAYLELAAEAGDPNAATLLKRFTAPDPSARPAMDKLKADWRSANPPLVED
jgi:TPR repeat protein